MSESSEARRWAVLYKRLGWQPIPAREIDGRVRPSIRGSYSHLRDHGSRSIPEENWWGESIQLCLGVRRADPRYERGLCVLDLDGPLAREVWGDLSRFRPVETWEVERDPLGGKHLWFLVPEGVDSIPHATHLWRLGAERHCGIELLGDRNLIVAPPSTRGETTYRFTVGPGDLPMPAELPAWVLDLASRAPCKAPPPPRRPAVSLPRARLSGDVDKARVFERLGPEGFADLLGIRIVNHVPSQSGWLTCRSVFREDRTPSASYWIKDARTYGPRYYDPASLGERSVGVFQLAVLLGHYPSVRDAINGIAGMVGLKP